MELLDQLVTTIAKRPYVFAFLAAYLFIASRQLGWARALLYVPIGYAIAWASEYASITTGFPYGWYHYRYDALAGELLVGPPMLDVGVLGVPFFDSLSYVFLTFAGWSMATTLLAPLMRRSSALDVLWAGERRIRRGPRVLLLGATLTMLLDVVIDPIAHRGSEWFLGEIYGYGRHDGAWAGPYFKITLENFGGWWLTSFAMIGALQGIDWLVGRFAGENKDQPETARPTPRDTFACGLLGAGLYVGVLAFNLLVTLFVAAQRALGHPARDNESPWMLVALFVCGVLWHAPALIALRAKLRA